MHKIRFDTIMCQTHDQKYHLHERSHMIMILTREGNSNKFVLQYLLSLNFVITVFILSLLSHYHYDTVTLLQQMLITLAQQSLL